MSERFFKYFKIQKDNINNYTIRIEY